MSRSLVGLRGLYLMCFFFRRGSEGAEVPTLRPNVRSTADEFFEVQASTFAFVTRGSCHSRKWRGEGLGQKGNPVNRFLLLD